MNRVVVIALMSLGAIWLVVLGLMVVAYRHSARHSKEN